MCDDETLRDCFRRHEATPEVSAAESLDRVRIELQYAWASRGRMVRSGQSRAISVDAVVPQSLGRYELAEKVGSGAFGVVYRAVDQQLNRVVALKLPRSLRFADPDARERFLREARAAAGLHHPQIVALYDAGESDGICYLASAFTAGETLGDWMARCQDIPVDDAARVVKALAEAVQHAHENRVLHRDIKPQNVLLDSSVVYQGLPFTPKLTDFGIAKLVDDDSSSTITGMLLGTPRYMAPELASGRRDELGPACDIYSLGVVLYELITGQAPISGEGQADTLRRVVTQIPAPPRRFIRHMPRDLDAICMTCLEKEPRRRYASAGALADDLGRFLRRETTIARPLRPLERIGRSAARQPAISALIGVTLTAALLIFAGMIFHGRRLTEINTELSNTNSALKTALATVERAQQAAHNSEMAAQQRLYISNMRLAESALDDGDFRELTRLLQQHHPVEGQVDRRGFEWYYLSNLTHVRSRTITLTENPVYQVRVAPDGRHLVSVGQDGWVRVVEIRSGRSVTEFQAGQGEVNGLGFSPGGEFLVTAGDDGTACIRRWADAEPKLTIPAHTELAFQALYTPDGSQILTCGIDPDIRIWNARTGELERTLEGHQKRVECLAISPDGKWVASGGRDGSARMWDPTTGEEVLRGRSPYPWPPVVAITFSADSRFLIAGDRAREIRIWDTESRKLIAKGSQLDPVTAVSISPDGRWVVTADDIGAICVWDLAEVLEKRAAGGRSTATLKIVRQWQGHPQKINSLCFHSDDRFVSAGADGEIRDWQIPSVRASLMMHPIVGVMNSVFTRDGELLAAKSGQGVMSWNLSEERFPEQMSMTPSRPEFLDGDAAGTRIAICSREGEVEVRDLSGRDSDASPLGRLAVSWSAHPGGHIVAFQMSPDGRVIVMVTVAPERLIRLYAADTGELLRQIQYPEVSVQHLGFSPDGSRLAFGKDNDVLICAVPSVSGQDITIDQLQGVVRMPGTHTILRCLAFSADGRILATGGVDRLIRLWEAETGELLRTLSGHLNSVESLCFVSGGRSLISVSDDGVIKVWNVAAGEELLTLVETSESKPGNLRLSPDGRWLSCILRDHHRLMVLDCGQTDPAMRAGASPDDP